MDSVVKIINVEENNNTLKFTLNNINVSYANAIRRIILSEIPCIVFKSLSHSENDIFIEINKTRLNNELLKQRISCIPIHINNIDEFPYEDYKVELDVRNDTNTIIYATTEDFKIKNINTNTYLSNSEIKQIFPPDSITGDYIDIVRLRPKLSDNTESEHIKLEGLFSISNANTDGMYNVVSTCSYGNTLDPLKIKEGWEKKLIELKEKNLQDEHIEFIKKDWYLLDSKRLFVENSFDYIIETIGIYSNYKIVELAVSIIIKKLYILLESFKNNDNLIAEIPDALDNCYMITLENEDYTIGKILEYSLHTKYFIETKELNYIGFLKKHPHEINSYIKVSFKNIIQKDEIIFKIEECINESYAILNTIKKYFSDN